MLVRMITMCFMAAVSMNWWQPDLTIGYLYNLLPGLDVHENSSAHADGTGVAETANRWPNGQFTGLLA
jgi:hypothetical protein